MIYEKKNLELLADQRLLSRYNKNIIKPNNNCIKNMNNNYSNANNANNANNSNKFINISKLITFIILIIHLFDLNYK